MLDPAAQAALAAIDALAPPVAPTLVIGCGNLLRGDDAAGPMLVRELWQHWGARVPPGVELCDGGTAGMDVAFKMRGRREVLVIDACHTGETPGTIYEVPGSEVETMAEPSNLHSHNFRWDHALAMARWLLKDAYPPAVRVFLIEAAQTGFGEPLSPPVQKALQSLKHRLAAEFAPRFAPVAC